MRDIVPKVLQVLAQQEKAACNENFLALCVLREMGVAFSDEQIAQAEKMPMFSSINRARARIQAAGRFRPQELVWEKRQRNGGSKAR